MAGVARPSPGPKGGPQTATEQMGPSSQLALKVSFGGLAKRRGGCYVPTEPQRLRALLPEILATKTLTTKLTQWVGPDGGKVGLVGPGDTRGAVAPCALEDMPLRLHVCGAELTAPPVSGERPRGEPPLGQGPTKQSRLAAAGTPLLTPASKPQAKQALAAKRGHTSGWEQRQISSLQKLDNFSKSPATREEADLGDDAPQQAGQTFGVSDLNIDIGGGPAPPEDPAPPEPVPPARTACPVAGYEAQVGDTVEPSFDHAQDKSQRGQ